VSEWEHFDALFPIIGDREEAVVVEGRREAGWEGCMIELIREYAWLAWYLTAASVVMFFVTLLAVPAVLIRIPADYFVREQPVATGWRHRHPVIAWTWRIGHNVLGWVLILAGIAMLVLPGPGMVSIFVGLMMVEFPGKFRLERWVVARPRVMGVVNGMRRKRGIEELRF
jgi:hypothetical protein